MSPSTDDVRHQVVAETGLAVAVVIVLAHNAHLMRTGRMASPEKRDEWRD